MLASLQLTNFRNFRELEFMPYEGLTLLCGPNGSGKSNLLEGIFYLGTGYSYRQAQDDNLVLWGEGFFTVRGEVRQGSRQPVTFRLEGAYHRDARRKIFRVNGKREAPGKGASYLPVVIFSPQDLLLIQGSPGLRRRFLDTVATQIWPHHTADINYYRGALVQRNNLLRRGEYRTSQMETWDEQLVNAGSRILVRRLRVITRLLEGCRESFASLGGTGVLTGKYVSRIFPSGEVPEEPEGDCIHHLFLNALREARHLEERLKVTVPGPHRDDLRLFLDGRDARIFCSQGEQRLIVLSLKIGQSRVLAEERQIEPLVLLDDVFSELDEKRRSQVLYEFCSFKQVIATTAEYSGDYDDMRRLTPAMVSLHVRSL